MAKVVRYAKQDRIENIADIIKYATRFITFVSPLTVFFCQINK